MTNHSTSLRGWTVSLLLHAAALAWLASHAPPLRPDATPVRSSTAIFVTLQPTPPPPPEPPPQREPRPVAAARAAPPRASRPAPRPVVTSTAPAADVEETVQPATPSEAPAAAPGFDIDAARATARGLAREQGAETPGGTTLKETREEKLGRALERARRKDCKTRYSGMGVLAIIPLVKDTVTDTGCKW